MMLYNVKYTSVMNDKKAVFAAWVRFPITQRRINLRILLLKLIFYRRR